MLSEGLRSRYDGSLDNIRLVVSNSLRLRQGVAAWRGAGNLCSLSFGQPQIEAAQSRCNL
jgi:hypothetical protein